MNYLLDSNTVSEIYDKYSQNHDSISQSLRSLDNADQVFISIITLYELEYGYSNAPDDKKPVVRKMIEEAKEDFIVLPLSKEGARLFGELKKQLVDERKLKKENAKKHNIDIILASTAAIFPCVLISADGIYHGLKQIEPPLKTQNWAKHQTDQGITKPPHA